ncbi:MAG: hypothetical protein H7258_02075 [Ferruginibacter sp.]|nr:hypothetical protein [Ferruginibacter sp.]
MGKYIKGILGSFQGKVGTVIGSSWKGIEYMRSRGKKSSKPPTQAQLIQQAKFTLLVRFVTTIGRLLTVTFKDSAIRMTGVNSAFAYNYDNAITGSYPAFSLDYSKVLVSKGQLHNAINPVVTTAGNGILKADWDYEAGVAMSNATDNCIVVVYCPELNQSVYKMAAGERSTRTAQINVANFNGRSVETWIAFITSDKIDVSSSFHTGRFLVS